MREFKNAKESVKFAIPIKQEARLNTGNVEVMPNSIEVGNESNIMFDINNTGKVILYNVTAIFEGDSIQRSENYVGNIKPGENGTANTVEKEIQLYVSEPVMMDDMFMDDFVIIDEPEPEPTMMDTVKKYALPLGAAAVVVLGGIVFFIRRKKKKAGMEDEIL